MRGHRQPFTSSAAIGVLLLVAGCGEASERGLEQVIESQAGADVDVDLDDDGSFSLQSDEGSVQFGAAEVPDSWPDDVPLPDLVDLTATEFSADGETMQTIAGTTPMSATEVEALFAELEGWTQEGRSASNADGASSVTLVLTRDDRELVVLVNDGGAESYVSISNVQRANP